MTIRPTSRTRSPWSAFALITAAAALTIMDLSKINVGLPSIQAALGADATQLQLIISGYALAYGIALVPSGRIGDLGSRKIMLMLGVAVFTLASLLAALAPNASVLLIGRVIQGIGAGMLMPQVIGFIQQLFSDAARGKAFGVFGGTIGIATAIGPTLGGVLIAAGGAADGWRWLFWMNVPLGLLILAFAWWLLPATQLHDTEDHTRRVSLDPFGILLIAVATVTLLAPFALTTGQSGDDPNRWWLLLLSGAAFAGFVFWERRQERVGKTPVIHLSLLSIASFRHGIIVVAAWFAANPALLLVVTLFLQGRLGLSPVVAGLATIPYALLAAVTSWWSGNRAWRFGRRLIILGLSLAITGMLLATASALYLPLDMVAWGIVISLTVIGLGSGMVMAPNQTLLLAEVPVSHGGVAGSIAQLGQRVGTAIGVALASAIFFSVLVSGSRAITYRYAVAGALLVVIGFTTVALIAATIDWRVHRRPVQSAEAQAVTEPIAIFPA